MVRSLVTTGALLTFFCAATLAPSAPGKTEGAPVNVQADSITFAIIGDYGSGEKEEERVAEMVKSWNPDFVITVGDNNYFTGSAATIKNHIGKYYCDFIYNPDARADWQCNGRAAQEKQNRFFPAPGNHDNYSVPPLGPYLDYFTLPGDETNYDFTWGPVHFYAINSGTKGDLTVKSKEAVWLHEALQKDTKAFKMVYFHHPPYSAGHHGSSVDMRWPFREWRLDAVLTGHEHFYAKATDKANSAPLYLICGSSGEAEHYNCNEHPLDNSKFDWFCDSKDFGAIKVKVNAHKAVFEYYAVADPAHPVDVNIINK